MERDQNREYIQKAVLFAMMAKRLVNWSTDFESGSDATTANEKIDAQICQDRDLCVRNLGDEIISDSVRS